MATIQELSTRWQLMHRALVIKIRVEEVLVFSIHYLNLSVEMQQVPVFLETKEASLSGNAEN